MIHVTCRLTAKNRDQLRNPTPGNRVWATFTFIAALGPISRRKDRPIMKMKLLRARENLASYRELNARDVRTPNASIVLTLLFAN